MPVDRLQRLALGSIAIGIVVLALKMAAYAVTGSVALLSDASESLINVAAALVAFLMIRLGAQPADANHPFGHHKAEYFSAVFEGVLIVIAALFIFREAYFALLDPQPITAPALGLAVNAVASVINGVWAWMLLRAGREARSPALVADARHLLADVLSSAAVIGGIVLAVLTGWQVLDPLLAALVAVNILWSGSKLIRESVGGLMDEAAPPDMVEAIRAIIAAHGEGAIEAHDLRTRHAGRATFVEFHLVVPGEMSVADAHDICDRIEAQLKAQLPGIRVTIHVEPEHKAKHTGVISV
jgi:cation diffusion facilitator family transporter